MPLSLSFLHTRALPGRRIHRRPFTRYINPLPGISGYARQRSELAHAAPPLSSLRARSGPTQATTDAGRLQTCVKRPVLSEPVTLDLAKDRATAFEISLCFTGVRCNEIAPLHSRLQS